MEAVNNFPVWLIVLWGALGIAILIFDLKAGYATKKSYYPYIHIFIGVALIVIFWAMGGGKLTFLVICIATLVTIVNITLMRFCSSCGATLYRFFIVTPKRCWRCGAKAG